MVFMRRNSQIKFLDRSYEDHSSDEPFPQCIGVELDRVLSAGKSVENLALNGCWAAQTCSQVAARR